jgi:hypothetical protein
LRSVKSRRKRRPRFHLLRRSRCQSARVHGCRPNIFLRTATWFRSFSNLQCLVRCGRAIVRRQVGPA